MQPGRTASMLLRAGFLPGIGGGLLAFIASNLWFHYLAPHVLPGVAGGQWMPDFFSYLQIDAYVGAGCGYAGMLTARNLAELRGDPQPPGRLIPILYAFGLAAGIALIVNVLLLFMSYI